MENNSILLDTALVIKYSIGTDTKGNDIMKSQRNSDINLLATDDVLLDLRDIVAGFLAYDVVEVTKETVHSLSR